MMVKTIQNPTTSGGGFLYMKRYVDKMTIIW